MKFALTSLLALLLPLSAQAQLPGAPSGPNLAAKTWVLYDYSSNQVLADQDSHERIEPASLTKLMTAYLTFAAIRDDKLSLTTRVTPSASALRALRTESRMFLDRNKEVSVEDLLRGLIVVSGNDAARVLAENIAGSEAAFAELMNKTALRLDLQDTHFVNATGLPDPQHYSSAYDLALLGAAIVRDFPEYYSLYSLREFQYNNIKQFNRNRLLWMDPYVDGMKTAHTESDGFCQVASAKRGEHRLIATVIGTSSEFLRASESQRLLNHGFQDFEALALYGKDQPITSLQLWKGTEKRVNVGFRDGLTITIPQGMRAQLKATIETQRPLLAPLSTGQRVGTLKFTLAGKPYLELPLVTMEAVPLANVFSRGIDSIRMLFD
ncbi:MAG TPA: D-alanyl-D-alanine carboxypeptidase family protein [Gallionellaceae bacterium]